MDPRERFLRACRRQPVDRPPVWFMRQAGRYMPEYRRVREGCSLLDLCHRPELAAEVTITAAERLGVDAAIICADLLLPAEPLGFAVQFAAGEGPVITPALGREADPAAAIAALPEPAPEALGYVAETVRLTRAHFGGRLAVIGFAGAPFTLASYLIEGGASRTFLATKRLLWTQPAAWDRLMDKLCALLIRFLSQQVAAGADAVQLFDSWAGTLAEADYRRYVLPYNQRIVGALEALGTPVIYFSTGTAGYLEALAETGASVFSVDWRVDLAAAWRRLGPGAAVQGNLDPAALLAPRAELRAAVRRVLAAAAGRAGHIFNLGHGVFPETPVNNVRALVEMVQAEAPAASHEIGQ
ncbi:MAG: uroporphyrinogen decarboxylase [Terriglobales bacterium]